MSTVFQRGAGQLQGVALLSEVLLHLPGEPFGKHHPEVPCFCVVTTAVGLYERVGVAHLDLMVLCEGDDHAGGVRAGGKALRHVASAKAAREVQRGVVLCIGEREGYLGLRMHREVAGRPCGIVGQREGSLALASRLQGGIEIYIAPYVARSAQYALAEGRGHGTTPCCSRSSGELFRASLVGIVVDEQHTLVDPYAAAYQVVVAREGIGALTLLHQSHGLVGIRRTILLRGGYASGQCGIRSAAAYQVVGRGGGAGRFVVTVQAASGLRVQFADAYACGRLLRSYGGSFMERHAQVCQGGVERGTGILWRVVLAPGGHDDAVESAVGLHLAVGVYIYLAAEVGPVGIVLVVVRSQEGTLTSTVYLYVALAAEHGVEVRVARGEELVGGGGGDAVGRGIDLVTARGVLLAEVYHLLCLGV